ncbi:inhibitor of growth proteins N-terminal histone-binding-domain-containing protein [Phyllosticta capitalensis]|uniref:Chromatin modification-related protein n=1 Tax=Phyllosticta capitalensis TaxID=121624 RepID=A0ABR1YXG5_9PEZI
MALTDDPASVLEMFIHDVANLPAEVTHLYEEMQAKEQQIQACSNIIERHDGSLQKFVKLNSSLVKNPKEEPYSKIIHQNYDKAQLLQEEKCALAEKAASLLDRHVKRLDIKIKDLTTDGSIAHDPQLPSLLRDSPGNLVPPVSSSATGANTPIPSLSNTKASQPLAALTIQRLAHATGQARAASTPGVGGSGTILHRSDVPPGSNLAAAQNRQREMSVSSDTKRRRLHLGSLPPASSSLARQSSIGPGTPKVATPSGSRAGSAGPRPTKKTKTVLPGKANRKKIGKAGISKKSARRLMGSTRASPSTTGDDESMLSDADASDEDASALGHDGAADDDGADMEEDADDTAYCICERVSFGDMVACDNPKCDIQWFHWECVGLAQEPKGEWLCPICDPNSKYDKKKKKIR